MSTKQVIFCVIAVGVVWYWIYKNSKQKELTYAMPVKYPFYPAEKRYIDEPRRGTDKRISLEYSNIDLYESNPVKADIPVTHRRELINNSNTRGELTRAGDLDWARYLDNIPQDSRIAPKGVIYEYEMVKTNYDGALYDERYHHKQILD